MKNKTKCPGLCLVILLGSAVCAFSQVDLVPGVTQIIQAEEATLSKADIETEHSGYTGSGYVNYLNETGGYVEWSVKVTAAAAADCTVVFANGSADRAVEFRVNGNAVIASYNFPGTGSWTNWEQAAVVLNLAAGVNTLRLTAVSSEGGPNLDRLEITVSSGSAARQGDVNGDSAVTIVDALMTAQYYVGLNPGGFISAAGDVNCDKFINIVDALQIAQYYVGLLTAFPACSTPQPTKTPTATPQPATPTPTQTQNSSTIHVAPGGVAGAAGTLSAPTTLQDAITRVAGGGTIYLRGGTYSYSTTIVIAEGNNGRNLYAYNNETPVLDFSAMSFNSSNRGVVLAGNSWHVRGITIQRAGDNGMLLAGHNNTIENCIFRENKDSGLQLSRYNSNYNSISQWPGNNLILNCTSRDNYDTDDGEDADGFAPKLTCGTGNIFRGCKALYNVDDGVDCYTKDDTGAIGAVRFENCEASSNGRTSTGSSTTDSDGNGFKLGDDTAAVRHVLINCVANNNKKHGYTGNGNPGPITLTNCTGSGNGGSLFDRL